MKKLTFITLSFFICFHAYSQEVKINVQKSTDISIVVEGSAPESLYLGVTAILDNTREIDFKVQKVKGTFSQPFMITDPSLIGSINTGNTKIKWVASLWEKKVTNCGCEYCKKNGYHMEGRVAKDSY